MGKLEGRVAVITGGGRNIGRAISKLFASEGAKIVIFDMDSDRASEVAEEIAESGGEGHPIVGQVNKVADVQRMIEGAVGHFGQIDILVNCAAISDRNPMLDLDDEDYHRIIDVTMNGTYYCCRYVSQQMVRQGKGGAIVNFSSGSAFVGNLRRVAYDMAKGAIVTLTMDMAVQLASHNIRTNCIAPGITGSQVGGQISFEDRSTTNLVGGRAGHPEEQADLALFLASDDSRHLWGQTFRNDGGSSIL